MSAMNGAGEMAESRKQGWPVGGWALLGDRLCRIQFWLLLAGTLFNERRIRRGDSSQDCQDGMAPPRAVNGKGCRPSIINTHQQGNGRKGPRILLGQRQPSAQYSCLCLASEYQGEGCLSG